MHTVVETYEFISQAKKLLTEEEKTAVINELGKNPFIGDIIKGTGGFRKIRVARKGSGKSGGYRVVYFFATEEIPVILISVYAKNKQENLTDKQHNKLYEIAQTIKKGM